MILSLLYIIEIYLSHLTISIHSIPSKPAKAKADKLTIHTINSKLIRSYLSLYKKGYLCGS